MSTRIIDVVSPVRRSISSTRNWRVSETPEKTKSRNRIAWFSMNRWIIGWVSVVTPPAASSARMKSWKWLCRRYWLSPMKRMTKTRSRCISLTRSPVTPSAWLDIGSGDPRLSLSLGIASLQRGACQLAVAFK
ncbi:hypothetical protein AJ88_31665 [Mesorhizobium amorphae CCBAU 01583]|nr:hypothetical protein AJ88_31665 [Mesorhizobium amorphae CCBAU 01583]